MNYFSDDDFYREIKKKRLIIILSIVAIVVVAFIIFNIIVIKFVPNPQSVPTEIVEQYNWNENVNIEDYYPYLK